jgi:sugar/nucleoside kinase (ribokinase family)
MGGRISADQVLSRISSRKVFVSPDYFVDHFIKYSRPYPDLLRDFNRIVGQGGGNVLGTRQYIAKGGNAVNTAVALGRLGVQVALFTKTDAIGLHLLRLFVDGLPIDLSMVDPSGSASMTAALEVSDQEGKFSNIMINDSGSLLALSQEDITEEVASFIRGSDVVCTFNWAQTKEGTEIAKKVFAIAKENRGSLTFIDISDPSYRANDIPSLVEQVFKPGLVDILSLNENELSRLSRSLGMTPPSKSKAPSPDFLREFSDTLGCAIDYHTSDFSTSVARSDVVTVPSFQVSPVRMTGAGDTWNAGDIVGHLAHLATTDRLLLANAAAGFYISNPQPLCPTLAEAVGFSEGTPAKEYYQ